MLETNIRSVSYLSSRQFTNVYFISWQPYNALGGGQFPKDQGVICDCSLKATLRLKLWMQIFASSFGLRNKEYYIIGQI